MYNPEEKYLMLRDGSMRYFFSCLGPAGRLAHMPPLRFRHCFSTVKDEMRGASRPLLAESVIVSLPGP